MVWGPHTRQICKGNDQVMEFPAEGTRALATQSTKTCPRSHIDRQTNNQNINPCLYPDPANQYYPPGATARMVGLGRTATLLTCLAALLLVKTGAFALLRETISITAPALMVSTCSITNCEHWQQLMGFPLCNTRLWTKTPGIEPGPLCWYTSGLTTELQELRQ